MGEKGVAVVMMIRLLYSATATSPLPSISVDYRVLA